MILFRALAQVNSFMLRLLEAFLSLCIVSASYVQNVSLLIHLLLTPTEVHLAAIILRYLPSVLRLSPCRLPFLSASFFGGKYVYIMKEVLYFFKFFSPNFTTKFLFSLEFLPPAYTSLHRTFLCGIHSLEFQAKLTTSCMRFYGVYFAVLSVLASI